MIKKLNQQIKILNIGLSSKLSSIENKVNVPRRPYDFRKYITRFSEMFLF